MERKDGGRFMTTAGLDCGKTLTKSVWVREGEYVYTSTADVSLDNLLNKAKEDGVTKFHVAGVGYVDIAEKLNEFIVKQKEGNQADNERRLQAQGVKKYFSKENPLLSHFLVVSVGTGTSYTFINGETIDLFPIGNPIGGGTLYGRFQLMLAFGNENQNEKFSFAANLAERGKPQDILLQEAIPEYKGTKFGEKLILSNGAKLKRDSTVPDIYATDVNEIATTTLRDFWMMSFMPQYIPPKDIVFIGTTVARLPLLRKLLEDGQELLGKTFHFPEKAEYMLALGAYHASF